MPKPASSNVESCLLIIAASSVSGKPPAIPIELAAEAYSTCEPKPASGASTPPSKAQAGKVTKRETTGKLRYFIMSSSFSIYNYVPYCFSSG